MKTDKEIILDLLKAFEDYLIQLGTLIRVGSPSWPDDRERSREAFVDAIDEVRKRT